MFSFFKGKEEAKKEEEASSSAAAHIEKKKSMVFPDHHTDDHFAHMPENGLSLFLEERCKTIHFVRHAEGFHNAANKEHGSEYPTTCKELGGGDAEKKYMDARLNAKGKEQCAGMNAKLKAMKAAGTWATPDLIVISPLTRTLETAVLCFGEPEEEGQIPTWLVHDLCRERWGKFTCDERRPLSVIKKEFSDKIDWESFTGPDEDDKWTPEREPDDDCCARGIKFCQWLCSRPEKNIVVVTHSSWLRHLFKQFGDNVSADDADRLHRLAGNCELRSVVLANHNHNVCYLPKKGAMAKK